MIFTADTKEIASALAIAGRVIPQKSPWPILTSIKIVTNDDRVTLIGSDADTTFEMDIPAEIETEGAACIPFAPMAKFCSAAKSGQIKITMDGDAIKMQSGRNRIGLSAANLDDYPNYRPIDGDPVNMDGPTFCHALRFCIAAVEDSEVRFHIAGPNFSEGDGVVHVWGTDGHSAHHAVMSDLDSIGGGGTLPLLAAQTILPIAEKADVVTFLICDRGWFLSAGKTRVWGKVIDGGYPNMDRVIGQFADWQDVASLSREDFSDAIGVAICGTDQDSSKSRNVVMRSSSGGPLVIRGHKASGGVTHAGRAEIEIDAKSDFVAALSAKYLSGSVSGLKSDDILLSGCSRDGAGLAVTIRPAQDSAALSMSAMIMAQRAALAELADV